MTSTTTKHKVLVVGSTGATGKHVVQMLLDRGDTEVTAITRSKDRLMGLLKNGEEKSMNNLTVVEGGIQEMSIDYLKTLCTTAGCTAVVRYVPAKYNFVLILLNGLCSNLLFRLHSIQL